MHNSNDMLVADVKYVGNWRMDNEHIYFENIDVVTFDSEMTGDYALIWGGGNQVNVHLKEYFNTNASNPYRIEEVRSYNYPYMESTYKIRNEEINRKYIIK